MRKDKDNVTSKGVKVTVIVMGVFFLVLGLTSLVGGQVWQLIVYGGIGMIALFWGLSLKTQGS